MDRRVFICDFHHRELLEYSPVFGQAALPRRSVAATEMNLVLYLDLRNSWKFAIFVNHIVPMLQRRVIIP
jgi:hypothetical protein